MSGKSPENVQHKPLDRVHRCSKAPELTTAQIDAINARLTVWGEVEATGLAGASVRAAKTGRTASTSRHPSDPPDALGPWADVERCAVGQAPIVRTLMNYQFLLPILDSSRHCDIGFYVEQCYGDILIGKEAKALDKIIRRAWYRFQCHVASTLEICKHGRDDCKECHRD